MRPLCLEVIELAGSSAGRAAVDLGCGLGRESDALLTAGWRVHAIDMDPDTHANLLSTTREADRERLWIQVSRFDELVELPEADLIYSGYALPYIPLADFMKLWGLIRAALRPGAWCAVNLLGDRDSYKEDSAEAFTFLPEEATRALFGGLELVKFEVEERDGQAFGGPKHWHLFNVIAHRPID